MNTTIYSLKDFFKQNLTSITPINKIGIRRSDNSILYLNPDAGYIPKGSIKCFNHDLASLDDNALLSIRVIDGLPVIEDIQLK